MKTKLKYIIISLIVAMGLLVAPITAQAEPKVIFEGSNATGIENLELDGTTYNVTFEFDSSQDLFGYPDGDFTFPGEEPAFAAIKAVMAVLNTEPSVETVGPKKSLWFVVPADDGTENGIPFVAGFIGQYYHTANEWDIGETGIAGVVAGSPDEDFSFVVFTESDGKPPESTENACPGGYLQDTEVDEITLDGQSCFINGVTVNGNVNIKNGENIVMVDNDVKGSVLIQQNRRAFVSRNAIASNLAVIRNEVAIVILNTVGETTLVGSNQSAQIFKNLVRGNLYCNENLRLQTNLNGVNLESSCR